jgi:flagellar hook-associated protein 3 FlgL
MRISTSMLNDIALNGIESDQSALSKTQSELSTGLSINSPSDNPAGEVQLLQLTAATTQLTQYTSNGQSATASLNLEENALSSATTTLQSVQSLVTEANGGTESSSNLQAIATEIQQLGQQLMGTANSTNGSGEYLFAGYSVNTQPFSRGGTGSVLYNGDSGVRSVQVNSDTSVQVGDSGSSVFMNVPTGNGTFTTSASSTNTGTGVVDAGSVTDAAAWTPGTYTVSFTDATDYRVTDSLGNVVGSGTYDPSNGGSIQFKGVEVGITGAPAAGDTFTVAPSGTGSVFDTLDHLVSALNSAGSSSASKAQLSSTLASGLQQLDNVLQQVSNVNTAVGSRISLISSVGTSLSSESTTLTTETTNLDGLDYAAATAQYSQQYVALQAAEQTYAQIGNLSLFKYL